MACARVTGLRAVDLDPVFAQDDEGMVPLVGDLAKSKGQERDDVQIEPCGEVAPDLRGEVGVEQVLRYPLNQERTSVSVRDAWTSATAASMSSRVRLG